MLALKRNFKVARLTSSSRRGFTLIELLVTISIFAILTGVVLFNQAKFNSSILLTNLAYDTALTIRQAQTYGINIKEFNLGGGSKFVPYGVHFDITNPKSFILFADTSYLSDTESGDGLYNDDDTAILSTCENSRGCVSRYNITRGNYIYALCVDEETDLPDGDCSIQKLDIVFQRPNPDAHIRANNNVTELDNATIIIRGADGSERKVKVRSNGLIQIAH